MNKVNHKTIGRYCYGGKIYVGQCSHCGGEHFLTVEEVQGLVNKSYIRPQTKLQQKLKSRVAILQKTFSLFL